MRPFVGGCFKDDFVWAVECPALAEWRSSEWMESGAEPPQQAGFFDPAQRVDAFDNASWGVPGTFQRRGPNSG